MILQNYLICYYIVSLFAIITKLYTIFCFIISYMLFYFFILLYISIVLNIPRAFQVVKHNGAPEDTGF